MADELPADFDTVVIGTGMPECILAAAHARNGRQVLHLDRNDYYGGVWATFNLDGLKRWISLINDDKSSQSEIEEFETFLKDGESAVSCSSANEVFNNVKFYSYIPAGEAIEEVNVGEIKISCSKEELKDEAVKDRSVVEWTSTKLDSLYRKFNLDLAPKLLFSRGELVELLISSNIARYAEFKSVTRVLTYLDGKLEQVPCSRADVFTTKNVSIVEKRMLMKLLTFCLNYENQPEEYQGYENKTFAEFVRSRKLTENVEHYVVHAIAMVDPDALTLEGLKNTKRFLNSLGRYGNTPFLWPIYGSGELPQAFCRLCAVFGGVYYLKRSIQAVILNSEGNCSAIVSGGKRIDCKYLIMESNYAPKRFIGELGEKCYISRAILITDRSVCPIEKEQITLLRLPASESLKLAVWVLELGPAAMVTPEGLYVIHLTGKSVSDAETDLRPAVDLLFDCSSGGEAGARPKVLWCLFFNQLIRDEDSYHSNCPANVVLTSGPNSSLDFDDAVVQARKSFNRMFPQEEFLPRAPDYEDIVIEDQSEPINNPGFESDEAAAAARSETAAAAEADAEEVTSCVNPEPAFLKEE